MPEIKHNFTKGRMNKDLDERLLPNGEYRDAKNIEVATSEDSEVGTIQNIKGNTRRSNTNDMYCKVSSNNCFQTATSNNTYGIIHDDCVVVGSVVDNANDKIYWLQHHNVKTVKMAAGKLHIREYDRILEYNTKTQTTEPVLVDNFKTSTTNRLAAKSAQSGLNKNVLNASTLGFSTAGIRPGMTLSCYHSNNGSNLWTDSANTTYFVHQDYVATVTDVIGNKVYISGTNHNVNGAWTEDGKGGDVLFPIGSILIFEANKVLNFDTDRLITGINIIDGVLFFTDNHNEPKKIHIERSKEGTVGMLTHTKVFSNGILQDGTGGNPLTHVAEEHVTVIKKSPLFPPTLQLSNTLRGDGGSIINTTSSYHPIYDSTHIVASATITTNCNSFTGTFDTSYSDFGFLYNPVTGFAYEIIDGQPNPNISILVPEDTDYLNNDRIILTAVSVSAGLAKTHEINAVVQNVVTPTGSTTNDHECFAFKNDLIELQIELVSIAADIPVDKSEIISWDIKLNQDKEAMFKFKFPRFAYRWKYEDGEYSCFSPFTETAFVPSKFDYMPRKGFNLGMTNEVRLLKLTDFINSETPEDVVEIDILYKESNSPNIYSVKTIKKEIRHSGTLTLNDIEWDNDLLDIESDLIYATIESNQLNRPWDNVPRKALGQEIVANRLVFANYLQGYDLKRENGQIATPNFSMSVSDVLYENPSIPKYDIDGIPDAKMPERSIKSLRTYQIGIVYKDKYGRETPVITSNNSTNIMSLYLEKDRAEFYNQIVVNKSVADLEHPEWADSFKFFIKETSNEYYNLAMDRWYPAEDGNIWLSFPSSDRNKVDLETFLILKKQHDNDTPVKDKARYKILAIENIAPEFITKKKFSYGNVATTFAATGLPTEEATYVDIDFNSFSSTGLHGSIYPDKQVNLLVRISSSDSSSMWYKVSDIVEIGSNVRITLEKSLGVDIAFTGDGTGTGTGNPSLSLQIVQERKEATKEFQGRFFAKIHRDVDLETNVLHQTEEQNFLVTDTLRYTALNINELDVSRIHGYESNLVNANVATAKYPYELLSNVDAGSLTVGELGHKNYLDPIDHQLVKQFWKGPGSGGAGATSPHFNSPAIAANGLTGTGYEHGDSWERFSWFIDAQWGENPVRNGLSDVISRTYETGLDLVVSEIHAFDNNSIFGWNPISDPADTTLSETTVYQGHGSLSPGRFITSSSINDNDDKILENVDYGFRVTDGGFKDSTVSPNYDHIVLGQPQIIKPSAGGNDFYRNLDRNTNDNTWRGFTNPDLKLSPGIYPKVEQNIIQTGQIGPGFDFDFTNVEGNNSYLSGKYETVDVNDYTPHAGINAYKFTAQHDGTIVKINTQFQVRPALDCDPDNTIGTPYGEYVDPTDRIGEVYNQYFYEYITGGNSFEVMHDFSTFITSNHWFSDSTNSSINDVWPAAFAGSDQHENHWNAFRNKGAHDNSILPYVIMDGADVSISKANHTKKNLVLSYSGGASVLLGVSQKIENLVVPSQQNSGSVHGKKYTVSVKFKLHGSDTSAYNDLYIRIVDGDGSTIIQTDSVSVDNGAIDWYTKTVDFLAGQPSAYILVWMVGGNGNGAEIDSISVKTSHEWGPLLHSKPELQIEVDTPLPGQCGRGSLLDLSFYNLYGNPKQQIPNHMFDNYNTEGGDCPGCAFTGNINGDSPAGMSVLPGYPNVGGLTGINARLVLRHNNTSHAATNLASGTYLDDQSTGFVPEHRGNAPNFQKIDINWNPSDPFQVDKGIVIRGDHFYAKNDYHLQLVLAGEAEIKLDQGESVWLEVESYEKQYDYKHYIGERYFRVIYDQVALGDLDTSHINNIMKLNWDLSSHPSNPSVGDFQTYYENCNAYYRYRGSYGGPIQIVEGNETECNLDQDFVHDLITPAMQALIDDVNNNNILQGDATPMLLGKVTKPVWGDAHHPSNKWDNFNKVNEEKMSYFTKEGVFPDNILTPPSVSNILNNNAGTFWHGTFLTKDRGSRLFAGVALPAGFGTSKDDKVTTSANFRSSPFNSGNSEPAIISDLNISTASFYQHFLFGQMHQISTKIAYNADGSLFTGEHELTFPYNVISEDNELNRIPKKMLTKLTLDQWHENSTALRNKGMLSISGEYTAITASRYNHKHPIISSLTYTDDLTAEDIEYLSGKNFKVGNGFTFDATSEQSVSYELTDHYVFKAASAGNFINFSFQWDPSDISHTYKYPLMFPFHKFNNGAQYNYDPSGMSGIGNWNTAPTNHEDIAGWIGTRIGTSASTLCSTCNHTYTAEVFDSEIDQYGDLYSSKNTSYLTDHFSSSLTLSQNPDIITVKCGELATQDCIDSSHVGWQILEYSDGGLNPTGGMFKNNTLVTSVSQPYFCGAFSPAQYCVDLTLDKLPNMTTPYVGWATNDARITFVNKNADVFLHPMPWKDDLRGIYYPPEESGKIDNGQSWYDDCYHNISSAIPGVANGRDFSGYGLHDNGKKLHLSFSGINNAVENWKKAAYNLMASHPELASNLWNLKSAGTMFRFKDDPNNCIYKIKSSINSYDQNTNGIGIRNYTPAYTNPGGHDWDHPSFDATHDSNDVKDPYSKRVRFYLEVEYTGWNTNYGESPTTGIVGSSSTGDYVYNPGAGTPPEDLGIPHLDGSTSSNPSEFPELTHNPVLGRVTASETKAVTSNFFSESVDQGELYSTIEFVAPDWEGSEDFTSANPAIFETEPKEDLDLDIYYEASPSYPVSLNNKNAENYFKGSSTSPSFGYIQVTDPSGTITQNIQLDTVEEDGGEIILTFTTGAIPKATITTTTVPKLRFTSQDGSYVEAKIKRYYYGIVNWAKKASVYIDSPINQDTKFGLPYFNCFSFGNGVESDRIRDDFNAVRIGKGVKAATTIGEQYKEERRKHSFIFSGIYNSNSGINKLNQFITSDDITKELNPVYGSIQKLHTRNTDLTAFCEDKVLRVLANKDALFNADGNFQLTSTKNVLGQAVPYAGEYGIGKYPESFASYGYRSYFVDQQRGCVLRLSRDGMELISGYGMKDWFRDALDTSNYDIQRITSAYDEHSGNLDVFIRKSGSGIKTVSFNEQTNGWVSFKSYLPENGLSINGDYYTFRYGDLFEHYSNNKRNNFYTHFSDGNELHYSSTINFLFNDSPEIVKNFHTINYEGSVANITMDAPTSAQELLDGISYSSHDGSKPPSGFGEYFNNSSLAGWHVNNIFTNLQSGTAIEFKDKEGKYFAPIKGEATIWESGNRPGNVDTSEFSVQGIGNAMKIEDDTAATGAPQEYALTFTADCWDGGRVYGCMDPAAGNYNPLATIEYPTSDCCYDIGCTNPFASNYSVDACIDDGSCLGLTDGCVDVGAFNYNPNANNPLFPIPCDDVGAPAFPTCCCYVAGCTDNLAMNYNPNACHDDGSCLTTVYGCHEDGSSPNVPNIYGIFWPFYSDRPSWHVGSSLNHSPAANTPDPNNPCCYVAGCTNNSPGFNPDIHGHGVNAIYDFPGDCTGYNAGDCTPGTPDACVYPCSSDGTLNGTPQGYAVENYNPNACMDNGSCITNAGCTDVSAVNTTIGATSDDGSCCYTQGCMDDTEGIWPNYMGVCRDGFVPGGNVLGTNPLAVNLHDCDYSCTADGVNYSKCGWSTYYTFNPEACDSGTGIVSNPGNINYDIQYKQYDQVGLFIGNQTTNIVDDSTVAGYENESWCFTPSASGCTSFTSGIHSDVNNKCADGSNPVGSIISYTGKPSCIDPGTGLEVGYEASNVDIPSWCDDPNTLLFPYENGIPNTAITEYKNDYNICPGSNALSCIIPGCMQPLAGNYNPSATVDDGSCVVPTYNCPTTTIYWDANEIGANGETLNDVNSQAYEPHTNTPISNFYVGNNNGQISTFIDVNDPIFEKYMDDICITDGGLNVVNYLNVTQEGTTCASCVYKGWDAATTDISYCSDWNNINAPVGWAYNSTMSNCNTYASYNLVKGYDGEDLMTKDNELSIPYFDNNQTGSQRPLTMIGYDPMQYDVSRPVMLGDVSGILHHLEYLNLDGHMANEDLDVSNFIRLKELSLVNNVIGFYRFNPNFVGAANPRILDLYNSVSLEKINFGNTWFMRFENGVSGNNAAGNPLWYGWNAADNDTYLGFLRSDFNSICLWGSESDYPISNNVGQSIGVSPSDYSEGTNGDATGKKNLIGSSAGQGRSGNSVIHGFESYNNAVDNAFPNFDNNIINYILTTSKQYTNTLNLKYLNINFQRMAQAWKQFLEYSGKDYLIDSNPYRIHLNHIRLDLSNCTNLEELHMQASPVASLYFNNGFESGYYPTSYNDGTTIHSIDINDQKLLHNDFAVNKNLKIVDTRYSQLFAHVNFAYNDKLGELYVGRGVYASNINSFSPFLNLPYVNMVKEELRDIIANEVLNSRHVDDTETILVSKDSHIMPPAFDFKANPTNLEKLVIVGERVGGSKNQYSLDRKGSGGTIGSLGDCHNCKDGMEQIHGPVTGNDGNKILGSTNLGPAMDIGYPLELVSMEKLKLIDLSIWTNGAIAVNTIPAAGQPDNTDKGKSHVYFGRADVTLTGSTHSGMYFTTYHYDRSNSSINTSIDSQSEIYGLTSATLKATSIVPGAKLSAISVTGGASWESLDNNNVDCYVVAVTDTSIKLSRDIGSVIISNFTKPAYQQVNSTNITWATHGSSINDVIITGTNLQLKFTMNNPDWSRADMRFSIAHAGGIDASPWQSTLPNNPIVKSSIFEAGGNVPNNKYEYYHPATIGQMQTPSDIVLHFGSQSNLDNFLGESGIVIETSTGKVINIDNIDSRYKLRNWSLNKQVEFRQKGDLQLNIPQSAFYTINIYCVI